jgi:hypothetical protein
MAVLKGYCYGVFRKNTTSCTLSGSKHDHEGKEYYSTVYQYNLTDDEAKRIEAKRILEYMPPAS